MYLTRTESIIKNFFYSNIRRAVRAVNCQAETLGARPLTAEQFYKLNQEHQDQRRVEDIVNKLLKIGRLKYEEADDKVLGSLPAEVFQLASKLFGKRSQAAEPVESLGPVEEPSVLKSEDRKSPLSRLFQMHNEQILDGLNTSRRFRKVSSVEIKRELLTQDCPPEPDAVQSPNCSTPTSFLKILSLNNSQMRGNMLNMQLMEFSDAMNWPMNFLSKEQ